MKAPSKLKKRVKPIILRDLGDGLVLRRSTPADAEALGEFNARVHSDDGPEQPDEKVAAWTFDLLTRPHPTFDPADFTIVEDAATGKIISSMNLISQTWLLAGIELKVGRPELVGTLPEYRNRGLVRAQFEVVHQWSADRGELVQAITGIPYYYRLFGYEMAMNLGGGRFGYSPLVPKLKEDEREPYTFRPAGADDLALISTLYRLGCHRSLVSCAWGEAEWRYELSGKDENNVNRLEVRIIESTAGDSVGFLAHPFFVWSKGATTVVQLYELKPGISWAAVTPSVIRYLKTIGEAGAAHLGKEPWNVFGFWLGEEHPAYDVLHDRLPQVRPPYAWYLRVPDLPGFLRLLTALLEDRLASSPYTGHTGELKVTFYTGGLKFVFEAGRIKVIEPWQPTPVGHAGDAALPGLTFLQMVFGYRSFAELDEIYPDAWADNDDAYGLLNVLFPRQPSNVWPVS
jgi:hypothetical protein